MKAFLRPKGYEQIAKIVLLLNTEKLMFQNLSHVWKIDKNFEENFISL